jgi:hypothetical protein
MRKLDNFRAREESMEDEDMEDYEDDDGSISDRITKDDDEELSSMFSGVRVGGSPTPDDFLDEYDSDVDVDETRVLDDGDYHATPTRRRITTLPQEQQAFGVGSSEMRAGVGRRLHHPRPKDQAAWPRATHASELAFQSSLHA